MDLMKAYEELERKKKRRKIEMEIGVHQAEYYEVANVKQNRRVYGRYGSVYWLVNTDEVLGRVNSTLQKKREELKEYDDVADDYKSGDL